MSAHTLMSAFRHAKVGALILARFCQGANASCCQVFNWRDTTFHSDSWHYFLINCSLLFFATFQLLYIRKSLLLVWCCRCDIPVIVMGETGCGKTTLIKFMCDLWKPPGVELKNLVLMKVRRTQYTHRHAHTFSHTLTFSHTQAQHSIGRPSTINSS